MNRTLNPLIISLSLCLYSGLCFASDIASSVRDGRAPNSASYRSIELGVGAGFFDNAYVRSQKEYDGWSGTIDASGELRYKGIFFEAAQGTQDGVNLGYSLWSNNSWSLDFLAASIVGSINFGDDDNDDDTEAGRNARIEEDDTLYAGAGIRLTRYYQNYVLQYRLVSDIYQDNGISSTLRIGRGWQVRNWHFSSILSARYDSSKANDYWYGIDEDEATELYPAYQADSSTSFSVLFNATKPLTENWVFRAYLGYSPVSSKLKDSPLLDKSEFKSAFLTLNYVFF